MGASCDVKIEIDRSGSAGTFTNHDIIRGKITLTVTTSISLNYIQAKLEGIAKSELHVPRPPPRNKRERDRGKDKLLQDVHKVLYDTVIVFPPDNIRQVSQAKEFTLTPGNYTYPFEFKIPLKNACVKLEGLTNKVSFNKKKFDMVINNGNFNTSTVKNLASNYYSNYINGVQPSQQQQQQQQQMQSHDYHIVSQLPPSLSGIGDFASIKYYVKVTCKRSSFLKTNLRGFDPFVFLPLDLDSHNQPIFSGGDFEEYREVFFRKELIFKDRIPAIVAVKVPSTNGSTNGDNKSQLQFQQNRAPAPPSLQHKKSGGTLSNFFRPGSSSVPATNNPPPQPRRPSNSRKSSSSRNYPEIDMYDVPFSFEIRFRHPAFLIPTKPPSFKLFLVSNIKPTRYSLAQYGKPEESNGLGLVYMQRLKVDLLSSTIISVLENDGNYKEIHEAKHDEVISICNNTYENLKFDLFKTRKSRSLNSATSTTTTDSPGDVYELEIPAQYYENCVLPDRLSPSFRTCNITRKYTLSVSTGFSSEKVVDFTNSHELNKKIRYVDLMCPNIKVLSGLNLTSSLHSNASKGSLPNLSGTGVGTAAGSDEKSQLLHHHQQQQQPSDAPPRLPNRPSQSNGDNIVQLNDSSNGNGVGSEGVNTTVGISEEWSPSGQLPTYDDVVRESSYQDNSEHYRARRRYQQHDF